MKLFKVTCTLELLIKAAYVAEAGEEALNEINKLDCKHQCSVSKIELLTDDIWPTQVEKATTKTTTKIMKADDPG